jgi:hypothetical protein
MKDDSRIIEVDGRKYTIQTTLDGQPAVYHAAFSFASLGHISGEPSPYVISQPIEIGCVLIVARQSSKE